MGFGTDGDGASLAAARGLVLRWLVNPDFARRVDLGSANPTRFARARTREPLEFHQPTYKAAQVGQRGVNGGVFDRNHRLGFRGSGVALLEAGDGAECRVDFERYQFFTRGPLEDSPDALDSVIDGFPAPFQFDEPFSSRLQCQRAER